MENLSLRIRRRLPSVEELKVISEYTLEVMNPYLYSNIGEFIADACDYMVNYILEDYDNKDYTPKDKDSLYYYLVDVLGTHIANYYKEIVNSKRNKIDEEVSRIKSMMGINESNELLSIRRRLNIIDDLVDKAMNEVKRQYYLCELTQDNFIILVFNLVVEFLYWQHYSHIDDNSEEWDNMFNAIISYIDMEHFNNITNWFLTKCGS
jgi:hypothetical protein